MKYKIFNTTDKKNLGLIIESNMKKYLLKNDYTFIPEFEIVKKDRLYLRNNNYIIEAIRYDDEK